MKGQLTINGKDAYTQWGVMMDTTSLSALLTPAGQKELIRNKCRLENGTRVETTGNKVAERDVLLSLQLVASDESDFFAKYSSFCKELDKRRLEISTSFQPGVVYKMDYQSMSSFTQFMRGIAKFSLKLNEPDPTDRNNG